VESGMTSGSKRADKDMTEAPRVKNAAFDADPQPYDPALEAEAAEARIDEALRAAREETKLVLVHLGGSWCPDCRILSGMLKIEGIAALIRRHYKPVTIDVGRPVEGRYQKNMHIARRFGLADLSGVPTLLVITPGGEVLNAEEASVFSNARDRNPQDLADYLWRHAALPRG
jgi:thiol-disulfide isomerase/thioredoxin